MIVSHSDYCVSLANIRVLLSMENNIVELLNFKVHFYVIYQKQESKKDLSLV